MTDKDRRNTQTDQEKEGHMPTISWDLCGPLSKYNI